MSDDIPRLSRGDRLVLASHNQGKLAEFAAMLAEHGVTLVSAADLGLPEPEETEDSFVGNARLKARAAAAASGLPSLADDSGFCVAALDGAPGIFSARWAGPSRDFGMAMQRVHDERLARGGGDTRAWFVSVLCLALPDGRDAVFEGRINGQFVWPPRGTGGHGYDPVFVPNGEARSFAEMLESEKNAISHRGRAFGQFRDGCLPG